MTRVVNKETLNGDTHPTMKYGLAQAGVSSGLLWAVADGIFGGDSVDDPVLMATVWVNLQAADKTQVSENNGTAIRAALAAGALQ